MFTSDIIDLAILVNESKAHKQFISTKLYLLIRLVSHLMWNGSIICLHTFNVHYHFGLPLEAPRIYTICPE